VSKIILSNSQKGRKKKQQSTATFSKDGSETSPNKSMPRIVASSSQRNQHVKKQEPMGFWGFYWHFAHRYAHFTGR
jgi:hypothetical protein